MKITNKTNISLFLKRLIRQSVGARNNCPVVIISGSSEPKLCGSSHYYKNKSGDIIHHPNAYRAAYGKPIYVPSSIRVEVGSNWILNNLTIDSVKRFKLRAFE